jgi:O-antigen/teichoic acid export membrane protein
LLSPSELGLLDLAAMIATLTGVVVGLGGDNAVTRLQPEAAEERAVWGGAAFLIVAAGTATLLVGLALQQHLAVALTGSAHHNDLILVALIYGVTVAAVTYALNAVRLRSSASRYAVLSFVLVAAEMVVAVGCALFLPDPVVLIVSSWAVVGVVGALVISGFHVRLLAPSATLIKRMLRYGLPFVPAVAAWVIGDIGIRAAIAHTGDLGLLGEYGIAFRITSVLALLVTGFGLAWQPMIYRIRQEDVRKTALAAGLALAALLTVLAVVLTAAGRSLSELIAGSAYAGASAAIPGLAAGMVAFGLFTVMAAVEGVRYRTVPIAIGSIIGMAVQIPLAFGLIGPMGVAGAGLASFAGYAVGAVVLATDVIMSELRP